MPVGKGSIVRATNASNQNAAGTGKNGKERQDRELPKILTDIPVAQVTEAPASWRKQDVSMLTVPELVKSIRKFGMLEPVIVRRLGDDQFQLLSGNSRLLAVKELGLEMITSRVLEGISDAQAKTVYQDLHRNSRAGRVEDYKPGVMLQGNQEEAPGKHNLKRENLEQKDLEQKDLEQKDLEQKNLEQKNLEQKDLEQRNLKQNDPAGIHEMKFKIVTTLSRDMPDYLL